jgi:hypothetical protein
MIKEANACEQETALRLIDLRIQWRRPLDQELGGAKTSLQKSHDLAGA